MGAEQSELVFETVALAGEILVSSGAEIFRVTETMERIAAAYGCEGFEPFVLSNGIMMTASDGRQHCLAKVRHIPLSGSRLDKVDAVNQLSREIVQGLHTPAEAHARLLEIQDMPRRPRWQQVLASGVGAGSFCYIFGGTLADGAAAFVAGLVLYLYLLVAVRGRLSKIAANITGGALVCAVAILLTNLGLGSQLSMVTVGSLVPLLPGVAFTNAIRDIADEDYISGAVRMLDVFLVVVCMAFGVGLVMTLWARLGGVLA